MRAPRRGQRGQETLQAILVVGFVLIPVLISILTFGNLVHVYIGAQTAAAAGARAAGTAGGFGDAEFARVVDQLQASGIDPARCSVAAVPRDAVRLDQPIAVTVSCPQRVGIPFTPFNGDLALSSTSVSRGEVNR